MAFYDNDSVLVSCIDGECDGKMEVGFNDEEEQSECQTECPSCGHKYNFIRNNWEDTPEDERSLNVYA